MIYTFQHNTPSGNHLIHVEVYQTDTQTLLEHSSEETIRGLCKNCVNYDMKWCCPPYSKKISDIIKNYNNTILVLMSVEMDSFSKIKNRYQQAKAANMILKSRCEKLARHIEFITSGYALLSGSCNLCKPCKRKINQPCQKSDRMRYSMESTGINVQTLIEAIAQHELKWYKKDTFLPYTSVVTMALNNKNYSDVEIDFIIKNWLEKL